MTADIVLLKVSNNNEVAGGNTHRVLRTGTYMNLCEFNIVIQSRADITVSGPQASSPFTRVPMPSVERKGEEKLQQHQQ